jgi:serine phosphatase RsbU (regulator of sigma subunit)
VSTVLTATVATVRPDPAGPARLRWSNAGHPPPVLLCADGRVRVLDRRPELLLGTGCPAPRSDHEVDLCRGDTLLLYTDGLVERRGASLDEGTAWLVSALAGRAGQPVAQLCDALLAGMAGRVPDDIAVLAVRIA